MSLGQLFFLWVILVVAALVLWVVAWPEPELDTEPTRRKPYQKVLHVISLIVLIPTGGAIAAYLISRMIVGAVDLWFMLGEVGW